MEPTTSGPQDNAPTDGATPARAREGLKRNKEEKPKVRQGETHDSGQGPAGPRPQLGARPWASRVTGLRSARVPLKRGPSLLPWVPPARQGPPGRGGPPPAGRVLASHLCPQPRELAGGKLQGHLQDVVLQDGRHLPAEALLGDDACEGEGQSGRGEAETRPGPDEGATPRRADGRRFRPGVTLTQAGAHSRARPPPRPSPTLDKEPTPPAARPTDLAPQLDAAPARPAVSRPAASGAGTASGRQPPETASLPSGPASRLLLAWEGHGHHIQRAHSHKFLVFPAKSGPHPPSHLKAKCSLAGPAPQPRHTRGAPRVLPSPPSQRQTFPRRKHDQTGCTLPQGAVGARLPG